MLEQNDEEEYLLNFKKKIESNVNIPSHLKAVRIAETYISLGRHSQSLEYFEQALNELKPLINDYTWGDVYYSTAGQYASTLDILGDLVSAERIYTHILQDRPNDFCIGDFAIFLHRRKRDFEAAERMYLSALSFFPNHASIHLKYAGFLRYVRGDLEKAHQHYRLSYENNPNYPDGVGGYASFLHGTGGDKKLAHSLYEKAIEADNCHVNNLCNFGLFLSEELQNFIQAEEIYRRALEVAPNHANSLYNYGVLLDSHCNRKKEAESLYCKCLEVDPKHSFALYNLAVLREEALHQQTLNQSTGVNSNEVLITPQEIKSLYERAVAADPNDATTMADCGRFISDKMNDPVTGEPYLKKSLQLDPNCDVAALHLGIIQLRHRKNVPEAIVLFRSVLARKNAHAVTMHQLAKALIEQHKLEIHSVLNPSSNSNNNNNNNNNNNRSTILKSPRKGSNLASQLISTYSNSNNSSNSISPLDEAVSLFEAASEISKEPTLVLYDYLMAIEQYGTPKHKLRAIVYVEAANNRLNITNLNDIERLIERLKA